MESFHDSALHPYHEDKMFYCDQCNFKSTLENNLTTHVETLHCNLQIKSECQNMTNDVHSLESEYFAENPILDEEENFESDISKVMEVVPQLKDEDIEFDDELIFTILEDKRMASHPKTP